MSQIMDNYVSKVHEDEQDLIIQSISIGGGIITSTAKEKCWVSSWLNEDECLNIFSNGRLRENVKTQT